MGKSEELSLLKKHRELREKETETIAVLFSWRNQMRTPRYKQKRHDQLVKIGLILVKGFEIETKNIE